MRTTIDLPSDLRDAVRSIARDRGTTATQVIVDLVRRGLGQGGSVSFSSSERTGLPVAKVGRTVTQDDVRSLDDDE